MVHGAVVVLHHQIPLTPDVRENKLTLSGVLRQVAQKWNALHAPASFLWASPATY